MRKSGFAQAILQSTKSPPEPPRKASFTLKIHDWKEKKKKNKELQFSEGKGYNQKGERQVLPALQIFLTKLQPVAVSQHQLLHHCQLLLLLHGVVDPQQPGELHHTQVLLQGLDVTRQSHLVLCRRRQRDHVQQLPDELQEKPRWQRLQGCTKRSGSIISSLQSNHKKARWKHPCWCHTESVVQGQPLRFFFFWAARFLF